jgi:membrane-associated phospholipid phosphatase
MSGPLVLSLALLATPAQVPGSPPPRTRAEFLLPESAGADDAVLRWNEAALQAIKAAKTPPPLAARHLAILHISMVDAITGVRHTCRPFEVDAKAEPGTSVEAAAAGAAHHVLTELYPDLTRRFDTLLDRTLSALGEGEAVTKGLTLGRYVAKEVLVWRAEDGADREVRFTPKRGPGEWAPTPPAFAKPLAPHWPTLTCFALRRGYQFRPDGPPKLTDKAYTTAFDEVRRLGAKESKERTADQTEIALFWADNEGTFTPPGHWNRIAQTVARDRGFTLEDNARLFALLNVALADVGIACWDCKYHFHFWRPIQGIRAADTDGNPDTAPDRDWEPLIVSPPFPSYTSGHSSFSGAAATTLAAVFGTDKVRFESTSDGLPGVTRRYSSFWAAAEEAGMSRIYGGIHWQFDNTDGLAGGKKVAEHVLEHCLKPARK